PPSVCASTEQRVQMTIPLLRTEAISKTYRMPDHIGRLVLDRLDFNLDDGEIVAILGKSGSGKSTFLRILAGLVPPSDGMVEYRGHKVTEPAQGIAMVFQTYALFPWLTVLGNVELGLEALGISGGGHAGGGGGRRGGRGDRLVGVGGFGARLPEGGVGGLAEPRRFCRGSLRHPRHTAARRAVLFARRANCRNLARRPSRSVGCQP